MLTILVGAVALFAFGALWFTVLFGKTWARLMNFTPEQNASMEKSMKKPLLVNFFLNVLIAVVVFYFFRFMDPVSFGEFIRVVLIVWLGFSFPIYANQALWEAKSWNLVLLNSAQGIISFIIVASVVYFMQ